MDEIIAMAQGQNGEVELTERFVRIKRKSGFYSNMNVARLEGWWVKSGSPPMWDLIATCQIDGLPGLLIVEAKAHENEMHREGKPPPKATDTRKLDLGDLSTRGVGE